MSSKLIYKEIEHNIKKIREMFKEILICFGHPNSPHVVLDEDKDLDHNDIVD
jgi:hypothetical protein